MALRAMTFNMKTNEDTRPQLKDYHISLTRNTGIMQS